MNRVRPGSQTHKKYEKCFNASSGQDQKMQLSIFLMKMD